MAAGCSRAIQSGYGLLQLAWVRLTLALATFALAAVFRACWRLHYWGSHMTPITFADLTSAECEVYLLAAQRLLDEPEPDSPAPRR